MIVSAQGGTYSVAMREARDVLRRQHGVGDHSEVLRNYGGDGLYRTRLATGDIVEVTVGRGMTAEAEVLFQ